MTVTLKDVAFAAKVSISTASRALAGGGLASPATQQRLLRIATELGYRPNPLARGLKTHQSGLIGLAVHNLGNATFQRLAEIAQTRLGQLGYQVLLSITGDDAAREDDTLRVFADHRIDGLIIVPTARNSARLMQLEANGIPLVCVVRRDEDAALEAVLADDPDGAYIGTRYLIGLGHRRIGLIVGRPDTTSGRERRAGYLRALQEAGLGVDETLIHAGDYTPETGAAGAQRLLGQRTPPSALFVANHESSLGVLRVIAERGISMPDALSLLCYEDNPWLKWHRPAISVIDSGAEQIADLAVDRLLHRLNPAPGASPRPAERQDFRIGAHLIRRGSCRALHEDNATCLT